jgi:hypothetical protein
MAGFTDNQDSTYQSNYWDYYNNFQFAGLFRGVFAGFWGGSFIGQGDHANLWSASVDPSNSNNAFTLFFISNGVYPEGYVIRDSGLPVRCLLD